MQGTGIFPLSLSLLDSQAVGQRAVRLAVRFHEDRPTCIFLDKDKSFHQTGIGVRLGY